MFIDPYMANVTIFGGNFAPVGWMFCDGSLLAISQYDALFALIGTTYGGDGQTTFALPDLRGRSAIHTGQLAGGGNYILGQTGGTESVTTTAVQLPAHTHALLTLTGSPGALSTAGNADTPGPTMVPALANGSPASYATTASDAVMAPFPATGNTPVTGSSNPIPTLSPFLAMNYIICVEGIFPSRN